MSAAPLVSVVMANRNGAAHLADAIASVLAQSLAEIELLLVDDASTDASWQIIAAVDDRRLRPIRRATPGGPAAARNAALDRARGEWIAVVDADDIILPDRLQRLLAAAGDATMVADDLVLFDDAAAFPPRRMIGAAEALRIDAAGWALANRPFGRGPQLGYLKPMMRRGTLRYDETLRVGEDYDLVQRLLLDGGQLLVLPWAGYFYRRHGGSISHRLPAGTLDDLRRADTRLRCDPRVTPALAVALDARLRAIGTAETVEGVVGSLKGRRLAKAAAGMTPAALPILLRFAGQALARRLPRRASPPRRPGICVISRQRITPAGNGSSAYLVSICRALRQAGFATHLISPTPGSFGRVPVLRLDALAGAFDSMAFRGGLRVGGWLVATAPAAHLGAALGLAARALRRLGLPTPGVWDKPAPYAMALPWNEADLLFVARHAQGRAAAVLADYAFCLPAAAHALAPQAPVAVLLHDLLSARADHFAAAGARDSVAVLDAGAEAALLAQADIIVAIQAEEGAAARQLLPPGQGRVIVAPMAAAPVSAPQPGEGGGLLFVGSATPPNIDAMRWFLAEIWPALLAARPGLVLRIAGHVAGRLEPTPGVALLGRVPDLAGLYRAADLVISPLRAGSGLKIKLIEALAAGKAIVASPVTLQGVSGLLHGAVALAESAAEFRAAVTHLLDDPAARAGLAARALDAARTHFSAATTYGPLIAALRAPQPGTARQVEAA